ncbi:hypothetical protein V8C44DRAFT_325477 [Trichoderma aethiopicum]
MTLVTQMPGLDIFLRRLCSQAQAPLGFTHRRNVQQRAACLLCLLTGCAWTGAVCPFACWVLRQTALARTVTCQFDNPPPPSPPKATDHRFTAHALLLALVAALSSFLAASSIVKA